MTNKKASRLRGASKSKNQKAMGSVSTASASAATEASTSPTVANATNMDVLSQASNFIVVDNSDSGLLKLPNEIKQRIFTLAVTVDEPIVPQQLRDKSNKFIWTKAQIDKKKHKYDVAAVPQLTAVQLAKTCKALYQEVAATHLFYTVNEFHFHELTGYSFHPTILTYLVAITEPRRKAIRSMGYSWQRSSKATGAQVFTLITACQGLQSLDFQLHRRLGNQTSALGLPGFKESLVAIQGLKKLTIRVESMPAGYSGLGGYGISPNEKTKQLRDELENLYEEYLKKARSTTYNLAKFAQAQITANLDVHGEGRLSEDKKPGLISSRTRQQVRNVDNLSADGTIPARESPKYDLNGDLTWSITTVEKSRDVVLEGIQSVEFFVEGGPSYNDNTYRRWHAQEGKQQKFWEDVTTLSSLRCRHRINEFYEKNPTAFGAQIVLDLWKLRDFESGPDERVKKQTEKCLEAMIKRQTATEQKMAEQAAREARQAAKVARQTRR